jgi:hypothetical protein
MREGRLNTLAKTLTVFLTVFDRDQGRQKSKVKVLKSQLDRDLTRISSYDHAIVRYFDQVDRR